jgi:hypothetical protein
MYGFKIGKTNNFEKRINQLNTKFANNKIIPIFCGKSKDNTIDLEKKLLTKMKKYKIPLILEHGQKPREFFTITTESYDEIKNFYEKHFNSHFECTNYEIDDDGTQYYKLSNDFLRYYKDEEITYTEDNEQPEDNDIPFLKLDSISIEKYWRINNRLYGKWKLDDGECDQDDNYDKDSDMSDSDSDFDPNEF